MTRFHTLAICFCLLALVGCSTLSPYSDLTKLDLTLEGSSELNPDLSGRPSPVVLRLMALKHPVAFENADFFSLYRRPREALAPDLITVEELELRPGETHKLKLSVEEDTRYIGVVAAYRNLPKTSWRYVIPVEGKATTKIHLALDAEGIRVISADEQDKRKDRD
ncbi:type VI secretion system lipoprotein TssJ [Halopseudomonas sp.]|uniref:type VI secretion system lipoprotein TssJ n=1 Tax=Halopseudomonas sp. TaxID=2901191 RepID=UPI003561885E